MVKWKVDDSNYNKIYPVGSIYMSINETNPSELFGGEWEQIKDKFLLSCGDTYNNGQTGGASTVSLTKSQMPRHTHTQNSHNHPSTPTGNTQVIGVNNDDWAYSSKRKMSYTSGDYYYPYSNSNNGGVGQFATTGNTTATNKYTGGTNTTETEQNGSAHENMPPYLAVYVWVRIA